MGRTRKITKQIFQEFVEWLATPENERPPQATMADKWHVCDRTIRNWMRDPEIGEAATDLAMAWVGAQIPQVISAMVRESKKGNVAAAKLMFELVHLLTQPGSEESPFAMRIEYVNDWRGNAEVDDTPTGSA